MFRDTLLESSPVGRKRKRWPMAIAFTVELLVGAVLIALPLLSTGMIAVSARPIVGVAPLEPLKPVDRHPPTGDPGPIGGGHSDTHRIVPLALGTPTITIGRPIPESSGDGPGPNLNPAGSGPSGPNCELCIVAEKPRLRPTRVSTMNPGSLINRVEPIYPRMLAITGVYGEVKLHAIIGKDGRIQSLTATSGHPLLARAAIDAVKQWRYQPYYLNGEAVEVETFITVNFNRN